MTSKRFLLATLALFFAAESYSSEDELYTPKERMEEWNDWRFGLFIHWGPWSQREIGYIWKMVNEEPENTGRKSFELWETFNPTEFDPKNWARAARDAGMKYVVFVTKHHDGFNNWDTDTSDFKSTNPIVPYHDNPNADLTKAVIEAFRDEGLAIGLYYSHIDWYHEDAKYFSRDAWEYDPSRIDSHPESWRRYVDFERAQLRELLTRYGKIDILWFDIAWPYAELFRAGEIPHPVVAEDVVDLVKMIRELQPDIVVNDRGMGKYGGFYTPEQQVPATGLPGYWESNITITNERGFWYKGPDVSAKSNEELVRMLIEIAAKGGNFLMNVGPRPDGELSATEYDALSGIGEWMAKNAESIHGTDRSLFADLPWGWSTTRPDKIYLHVFDWPSNGELEVPGLISKVSKAYLLEDKKSKSLKVESTDNGKRIRVGNTAPNKIASVVVLETSGERVVNNTYRQVEGQPIQLSSAIAKIESATASYNYGTATRKGNFIQDINSPQDKVTWNFKVNTPGEYAVILQYAAQNDQAGSVFTAEIGGEATFKASVEGTADWTGNILEVQRKTHDTGERHNNLWLFKEFEIGRIHLSDTGDYQLTLSPESIAKDYLAFIKSATLSLID